MQPRPFSTYDEALDWLFNATDYERMRRVRYNADTFDLNRMGALLERLGNPHQGERFLHVAGTKGKGSTAIMLAEVLRAAGHRVGLYTSPHVVDLRERIRVDGVLVGPEALRDLISVVKVPAEALGVGAGAPTFFEILTVIALLHFRNAPTDVSVLEVGLGGRLDATNVVTPLVAAITSLSLDHTAQLGNTLAEIATEKAGIMKPGVPVVCAPQPQEALHVIERMAAERGAPLWVVGRDVRIERYEPETRADRPGSRITVATPDRCYDDIRLPAPGRHQATNAAVAIGVLARAARGGLDWNAGALHEGLNRFAPAARIQVLSRSPWVINDGAHNAASIRALAEAIGEAFPHRRMILVFASAADHDYAAGLAEILPLADHVILTTAQSPKSASPQDLERAVTDQAAVATELAPDAAAAGERALALAETGDLVCFTGSFYLAGHVAEWWQGRRVEAPQRAPGGAE